MFLRCSTRWVIVCAALATLVSPTVDLFAQGAPRHNVILFVADGLRRGSVDAETMPTFFSLRQRGVDFRNSHAVFPTFTTANASAIATGHGLGDTGDYSNVIWPGRWLTRPEATATSPGLVVPFLENDGVLADMNASFGGNYLHEPTLLGSAQAAGYNVAAVGKLGPTAIQSIEAVGWNEFGALAASGAIIIDDATGTANGLNLPPAVSEAMEQAGLLTEAPQRSNGFTEAGARNNGNTGDAQTPGTRDSNHVQQQWFTDVATQVLLPRFVEAQKPFVLMFWSRDPDGTQHNQGDSLQQTTPGINGPTAKLALRNADRCLKQLLDWLDAHPAIKAVTDVVVTSDHGFATITRREIASDGTQTSEPSAVLDYELGAHEKPEPKGTLPSGFLAVDLAIREHLRVFDVSRRPAAGPAVFGELTIGGERSQHPEQGSAMLSPGPVQRLDGSDAQLIVASNGGSDLIYAPTHDAAAVQRTVEVLGGLDYVGGLFADETLCGEHMAACPGALPLSAIGFVGSSAVPRPAIVVAFKVFCARPGDLQSAVQIFDITLQEGQGMHGGFGRDSTWNNMAAMGPDFREGFVDELPAGNMDLTPTLAKVLGLTVPAHGSLRGRVTSEALRDGAATKSGAAGRVLISTPTSGGLRTVLEYQELDGVRYNDRACFVAKGAPARCGNTP